MVVLNTPTLQDDEVLVVRGAQQMICMSGCGRDAHFSKMLDLHRPDITTSFCYNGKNVLFYSSMLSNSTFTIQASLRLICFPATLIASCEELTLLFHLHETTIRRLLRW